MQQSLFGSLVAESPKTESPTNPLVQTLSDAIFTVIDCETTGLSAKKNSLTEVTAIQYQNGEEIGKYSTLIQPLDTISPEVEALTGISNEMVSNAPPLVTVLSELCSFVGSAPIIVGHNVGFDIRFITEKLQSNGLGSLAERFTLSNSLCTKALAVRALPGLPSYEGIVVATQCGVVNPNPHRAESDVRMSAGILFALIDKLQKTTPTLKTVADLIQYQGVLS
ncbi:MAG: 3'-5' exonuclease [Cyanobacteria bacterium]|nr:3'-5' exonuclease [Cyanobacteriota bacterium]